MKQKKTKTPQLEDGFFRTANELGEAFACSEWLCARSRVVFLLLRMCYGTFEKRQKNPITVTEFVASGVANRTGLSLSEAKRTIKALVDGGVISVITPANGRAPAVYGVQKDYLKWCLPTRERRRLWPDGEHHKQDFCGPMESTTKTELCGPMESTTNNDLRPDGEHHKKCLVGPQRDVESTSNVRAEHLKRTCRAPQIQSKPAPLSQKTPLLDRDRDRDNTPSLRSGGAGGKMTDLHSQCLRILSEVEFGLPGLTQRTALEQFLATNFSDAQKIDWLRAGVAKVKSLYGKMEIGSPSGFAIKHAGQMTLRPAPPEEDELDYDF